jgi:flagellar P-ring protein precursor FlgI
VGGATIERDLNVDFSAKKSLRLTLNNADFTTASRIALGINMELGGLYATAQDSGTVDVVIPFPYEGRVVELVALLENIQIYVDAKAKVVLNERTGTIVMGDDIQILPVAISHGDLSIEVKQRLPAASPAATGLPGPVAGPAEAQVAAAAAEAPAAPAQAARGEKKKVDRLVQIEKTATVSDLVKVLNLYGVRPKDLTAIFQTLKHLGALQAELEIM